MYYYIYYITLDIHHITLYIFYNIYIYIYIYYINWALHRKFDKIKF